MPQRPARFAPRRGACQPPRGSPSAGIARPAAGAEARARIARLLAVPGRGGASKEIYLGQAQVSLGSQGRTPLSERSGPSWQQPLRFRVSRTRPAAFVARRPLQAGAAGSAATFRFRCSAPPPTSTAGTAPTRRQPRPQPKQPQRAQFARFRCPWRPMWGGPVANSSRVAISLCPRSLCRQPAHVRGALPNEWLRNAHRGDRKPAATRLR